MKSILEYLKNLFTIPPDEDEDEEEIVESLPEKDNVAFLKEHSRNNDNRSQSKPLIQKRFAKASNAHQDSFSPSLEIDYITIPRDEKEALDLAKVTIDKLQNGHPVIASAKEIIRDGKYYFMLFGACYALQCKIEKITQYSYLFLPQNYNVNALNKKEFIHPENRESFLGDIEDSSF
ncbi:MAG: cell division protein SepF [Caldisericia bacterium]|nr:cell division protein SepF [Caldisericia bacterium]MDD4615040.1 cell division protein SepF [Caldisericia bacterium]